MHSGIFLSGPGLHYTINKIFGKVRRTASKKAWIWPQRKKLGNPKKQGLEGWGLYLFAQSQIARNSGGSPFWPRPLWLRNLFNHSV